MEGRRGITNSGWGKKATQRGISNHLLNKRTPSHKNLHQDPWNGALELEQETEQKTNKIRLRKGTGNRVLGRVSFRLYPNVCQLKGVRTISLHPLYGMQGIREQVLRIRHMQGRSHWTATHDTQPPSACVKEWESGAASLHTRYRQTVKRSRSVRLNVTRAEILNRWTKKEN